MIICIFTMPSRRCTVVRKQCVQLMACISTPSTEPECVHSTPLEALPSVNLSAYKLLRVRRQYLLWSRNNLLLMFSQSFEPHNWVTHLISHIAVSLHSYKMQKTQRLMWHPFFSCVVQLWHPTPWPHSVWGWQDPSLWLLWTPCGPGKCGIFPRLPLLGVQSGALWWKCWYCFWCGSFQRLQRDYFG